MRCYDNDIPCLLDMISLNVALQTLATAFLGGAVVLFNTGNYLWACVAGALGIIAYVVYEKTPNNPA